MMAWRLPCLFWKLTYLLPLIVNLTTLYLRSLGSLATLHCILSIRRGGRCRAPRRRCRLGGKPLVAFGSEYSRSGGRWLAGQDGRIFTRCRWRR